MSGPRTSKRTIQLTHALMPEDGFLKGKRHQAQEAPLSSAHPASIPGVLLPVG